MLKNQGIGEATIGSSISELLFPLADLLAEGGKHNTSDSLA